MIPTCQLFGFCIYKKFILILNVRYPKSIDKAIFFHYTYDP